MAAQMGMMGNMMGNMMGATMGMASGMANGMAGAMGQQPEAADPFADPFFADAGGPPPGGGMGGMGMGMGMPGMPGMGGPPPGGGMGMGMPGMPGMGGPPPPGGPPGGGMPGMGGMGMGGMPSGPPPGMGGAPPPGYTQSSSSSSSYTQSSSSSGGGGGGSAPGSASSGTAPLGPIGIMATAENIAHFKENFKAASFTDDKITFVKTICQNYVFNTAQVAEMLEWFTFSKIEGLELFRNSVVDPENADRVEGSFSFSSDKEEATTLLRSFPRAEAGIPFAFAIEDDGHRSEAEIARFCASLKACSFSDDRVEAAACECRDHPNPPFDGPQLVRVLETMPFSDDAQTVLGHFLGPQIVYPMTCQQVIKVLDVFSMSSDKIAVLPALKPFISDGQNKLDIVSHFTFGSDKEEAERILRDVLIKFKPKVPPMDAIQMALKKVGRCPAGYAWRQVSGGWRCAAGGHYVSDATLQAAM